MTKIIEELLSTLNYEANVRDICVGLFHTAVLTRNCGLASTLPRDVLKQERTAVQEPGYLHNKSAFELAQMAYQKNRIKNATKRNENAFTAG